MGRFSKLRDPARLPAPPAPEDPPPGAPGGARDRARLRRRLRYLRHTREVAFRDLGGFVFDARRFNRPREDIVEGKLKALRAMDRELRALETALGERREVTLLHEPGITACRGCGEIHGSGDNFCPGCGLPRGRAGLPPGPPAATPRSAPPAAGPPRTPRAAEPPTATAPVAAPVAAPMPAPVPDEAATASRPRVAHTARRAGGQPAVAVPAPGEPPRR